MPVYSLPSVYLGSDQEARELSALIRSIPKRKQDIYTSQNDFLKHCILYTMEHDPDLRDVHRKKAA